MNEGFPKNDTAYVFTALHEFLKNNSLLDQVAVTFEGGRKVFSLSKLEEILPEEKIKEIVDLFYQLKKEHVQVLVDMFVEPDEFFNMEQAEQLKDVLIEKVESNYKSAQA